MDNLTEIQAFIKKEIGVSVSESTIFQIEKLILEGHQSNIFRHEIKNVKLTKQFCLEAILPIIERNYPFPTIEGCKELISNELINESKTPNLTDTVRYLLIG